MFSTTNEQMWYSQKTFSGYPPESVMRGLPDLDDAGASLRDSAWAVPS